jgi:short-subunit dehydrogenase
MTTVTGVKTNPNLASLPNPFIALITGAARGIGEATVRRFAREPGCQLVLVDREEAPLQKLAGELSIPSTWVAADLTDADAPTRIRDHVIEKHGHLYLLVNNAGARWTARFAEGGWENVRRTMAINFDAAVRLTEALLPILRESAPSAIVNVSSLGGRVARPATGGYAASKAAIAAWSDALSLEEAASGVHVGVVLPGFVVTEGFPQRELLARRLTRWTVATPGDAADAIFEVATKRKAERYVPRGYAFVAAARVLFPGLVRRVMSSTGAALVTPQSGGDASNVANGAALLADQKSARVVPS